MSAPVSVFAAYNLNKKKGKKATSKKSTDTKKKGPNSKPGAPKKKKLRKSPYVHSNESIDTITVNQIQAKKHPKKHSINGFPKSKASSQSGTPHHKMSEVSLDSDEGPEEVIVNGGNSTESESQKDPAIGKVGPKKSEAKRSATKRKKTEAALVSVPAKEPKTSTKTQPGPKSKKKARIATTEPEPQPELKLKSGKVKKRSASLEGGMRVDSIEKGKQVFEWLINPIQLETFMVKYWETNVTLIKRRQENYFSHLLSLGSIHQMLLKHNVEFTKNLDITSYKNGVRETLNPDGRAMPAVVWDHYKQGCSVRFLNPQTFVAPLHHLCATLQEYFHCMVGTNAYLTPPNSQGFAPHYDDIEAFVLQIEGRKRWRLYKPRSQGEVLPRVSSHNFTQEEIGKPIMEEVLKPGDVLYFPRGTIHQASTEPGFHSLHITLSVYQKQSFADLFEHIFPKILRYTIGSNVDYRRGMPLHIWRHAGLAFSHENTQERAQFHHRVGSMLSKCLGNRTVMTNIIDAAVDEMAKKFQHEALPPVLEHTERMCTVFGTHATQEEGEVVQDYEIDLRTNVRLLRANILRLLKDSEDSDKLKVFYYLDNSKEYCEYEANYMEIDPEDAASVEVLIKSYPEYVGVSQLPLACDEHKIQVVTSLWERGLLMLEKPLK